MCMYLTYGYVNYVCVCVSVCLHGMYDMYGMYVLKYVCVYDMYMNTYYILSIWLYDTTNILKKRKQHFIMY